MKFKYLGKEVSGLSNPIYAFKQLVFLCALFVFASPKFSLFGYSDAPSCFTFLYFSQVVISFMIVLNVFLLFTIYRDNWGNGAKIISVDGIDGSGKTTLCKGIADKLTNEGYRVACMSIFVDNSANSKAVKRMLDRDDIMSDLVPFCEKLVACFKEMDEYIQVALKPKTFWEKLTLGVDYVVLDRSLLSFYAYGRGLFRALHIRDHHSRLDHLKLFKSSSKNCCSVCDEKCEDALIKGDVFSSQCPVYEYDARFFVDLEVDVARSRIAERQLKGDAIERLPNSFFEYLRMVFSKFKDCDENHDLNTFKIYSGESKEYCVAKALDVLSPLM